MLECLQIGSRAALLQMVFLRDDIFKSDYDAIVTPKELSKIHKYNRCNIKRSYPIDENKHVIIYDDGIIWEFEIAYPDSTGYELLQLCNKYSDYKLIDVLYMLKLTHRFKKNSKHFHKTRNDILAFEKHGAKIDERFADWMKRREAETCTNKLPNLNVTKGEFFNSEETGVVQMYDHDSVHEAIKFMDIPAYKYFLKSEVFCDMQKFKTLPDKVKLYAVLEECLVLAAERSQLCYSGITEDESFMIALEKVSTHITGGEFREYAWRNFDTVKDLYYLQGCDYMEKVYEGIDKGTIVIKV